MEGHDAETLDELKAALEEAKAVDAPVLIRAKINLQGQKTPYFLEDPVVLADTFRRYLTDGRARGNGRSRASSRRRQRPRQEGSQWTRRMPSPS